MRVFNLRKMFQCDLFRKSRRKIKWDLVCQPAHGGDSWFISNFSDIPTLYQALADCFQFPLEDLMFCTLNTHRVEMDHLLINRLNYLDMIFYHTKGKRKNVKVTKTEFTIGLKVADNGIGCLFIKGIRRGSVLDHHKGFQVGDAIERVDGRDVSGWNKSELAEYIKSIPIGKTFTMRIAKPRKADYYYLVNAELNDEPEKKKIIQLRSSLLPLRTIMEEDEAYAALPEDFVQRGVGRINQHLENFMGITDTDLAKEFLQIGFKLTNKLDFVHAVDRSDLELFGFSNEFLDDVWKIIDEAKVGKRNNIELI